MYTDRRCRDYMAMVKAVPHVDDVQAVRDKFYNWQLVCTQPLATQTCALIALIGAWLPDDPRLAVSIELDAPTEYMKVSLFCDGKRYLRADHWTSSGDVPLNAHVSWPPDWPLGEIIAQATTMANTLLTLKNVYNAMVVDAMVNNRADDSARTHATELFTFLVGIREEA